MSALLAVLAGLILRALLLLMIVAAALITAWVLWDCTAGPSARLAAAQRARGGDGGA